MVTAQLLIRDPATAITIKAIIEAAGHRVVEHDPQVLITDDMRASTAIARTCPTLVLATAAQIREAVAAMRAGVFGYIFVPLQPGEAPLMIERAAGQNVAPSDSTSETTLGEVEARHILGTLRQCKYNQSKAAKTLGIGRNTLWRKLKRIRSSDRRQ